MHVHPPVLGNASDLLQSQSFTPRGQARSMGTAGVDFVAPSVPTVGLLDLTGANAGQIKFPASQNPSSDANTLDDYAEGTWVPVLDFTTHGDLAVTYSTQTATYTKVGRLVTVTFSVITSAFTYTTAVGSMIISGLPTFSTSVIATGFGACQFSGINKAGGYTQVVPRVGGVAGAVDLLASGMGVGVAAVNQADVPTGTSINIRGQLIYIVG